METDRIALFFNKAVALYSGPALQGGIPWHLAAHWERSHRRPQLPSFVVVTHPAMADYYVDYNKDTGAWTFTPNVSSPLT